MNTTITRERMEPIGAAIKKTLETVPEESQAFVYAYLLGVVDGRKSWEKKAAGEGTKKEEAKNNG